MIRFLSSFLIFLFLTIRFSISLFTNLEYTTNMTYSPYRNISDLIKPDILPLLLLAIIFLFSGQSKKALKNLFSLEIFGTKGKLDIIGKGGSYGLEQLICYKMTKKMNKQLNFFIN